MMKKLIAVTILTLAASPAWAVFWQIGDDDGYGRGIPDNADHDFVSPVKDGRSASEVAATNGAQYTDTYSTTHQSYSPADQTGNVATFSFTGLGNSWTEGSMWFDLADFQASTFGAVKTTYNGIDQNWAFNDGYPSTNIHFFDLGQDVLDSINLLQELVIVVDRQSSGDFYGFDYALLSDRTGDVGNPIGEVPVPAAIWLFGTALIGFIGVSRRRKVA